MKAVVKIGGKQYYVSENDEIFVEKIDAQEGQSVKLNQVMMIDSKVGEPFIKNAYVEADVVKNGKNKKIRIFKYKQKSRSNRLTQGHRQPYTKLKITKIVG